jgi:hypothetical protein
MNNRTQSLVCVALLAAMVSCTSRSGMDSVDSRTQESTISGELKQWHRVTLSFAGPGTSEIAEDNPFLNYRLQVIFTNGARTYSVPGYYAADGNAGETSSESGNIWKVHFNPDTTGTWNYSVSFRKGENIAIMDDAEAGQPVASDGAKGAFNIAASDKHSPDFRAKGQLRYVGKHYLQFAGSKEYYIKGGADSPENFLAYEDFDGTYASDTARDNIKSWGPHIRDWKEGDPVWQGRKGKGIIGALNYLAFKGVNSVYFITMNINGDGRDVWPYTSHSERLRFDCSKLDQWEKVFEHMNRKGIVLHLLTQETENETLLDNGDTGLERRLYYRELIARFGHHNGLVWNLGEENGPDSGAPTAQNDEQRAAMANYFEAHDPVDHAVYIHTWPHAIHRKRVYAPLLGHEGFDGPSFQFSHNEPINEEVAYWLEKSREAGHPWVANLDETGPASHGVLHDAAPHNNQDTLRAQALWGTLMAGGAGVEWYFGYKNAHHDLSAQDFRPWERVWNFTRHAVEFYQDHLPFIEMHPANDLTPVAGAFGFAKAGKIYAFYFPIAREARIKLPAGSYSVEWFDPRNGGKLQQKKVVQASDAISGLGNPPNEPGKDWLVLVKVL